MKRRHKTRRKARKHRAGLPPRARQKTTPTRGQLKWMIRNARDPEARAHAQRLLDAMTPSVEEQEEDLAVTEPGGEDAMPVIEEEEDGDERD